MKILSLILLVMLLAGCAPQANLPEGTTVITRETEEAVEAEQAEVEETIEAEEVVTVIGDKAEFEAVDYQFTAGDVTIKPTEKYELINTKLETPVETGEAPSCAFEGLDTVYVFDGYEIQCGMIRGEEVITGVFITDEDTATPEGLKVGMSIDDMIKIYGSDFTEDFGAYTYQGENVELIVVSEDNKVLTISYIGKFE